MKIVNGINGVLRRIELYVGAVGVAIIFVLTAVNIILRYFFNSPILWAEEVIKFSFVWLGFLAIAYTLSYDNHVRFTMILEKLPHRANVVVNIIIDLMIAACFIILFPSMLRCYNFMVKTPALVVSEKYFYNIMPIGYSLFIIHTLLNVARRLFPKQMDDKPPFKPDEAEVQQ